MSRRIAPDRLGVFAARLLFEFGKDRGGRGVLSIIHACYAGAFFGVRRRDARGEGRPSSRCIREKHASRFLRPFYVRLHPRGRCAAGGAVRPPAVPKDAMSSVKAGFSLRTIWFGNSVSIQTLRAKLFGNEQNRHFAKDRIKLPESAAE